MVSLFFFVEVSQNLPKRYPGNVNGGLFKFDPRCTAVTAEGPVCLVPGPGMVLPVNGEPNGLVCDGIALDMFGSFRLGITELLGTTSPNEGRVPTANVDCGPAMPFPLVVGDRVSVVLMPWNPESPLPGKPCSPRLRISEAGRPGQAPSKRGG